MAKEKDGTALRRLVITEEEKAGVFELSATLLLFLDTPADNTLRKIKERFYWPDYYKNTMEMVSYKLYLFANHPVAPPGGGGTWVFFGGYVPPGTPNCHPVLKKISPKIDTPF